MPAASSRPRVECLEDRTVPAVSLLKDIQAGPLGSLALGFALPEQVVVGNTFFFTAGYPAAGYSKTVPSLWKSDGTTAGTTHVLDPSNPALINPTDLTNVSGTLFFAAQDTNSLYGVELWKTDGTETGTMMVKNIGTASDPFGISSNPDKLTNVNGTLYFIANDTTHGKELWKSDGTTAGTVLVKDINPGTGGSASFPYNADLSALTNVNGVLYFVADDGTHGAELWKSDGTDAGTVMVKDINSGAPSGFVNFGIIDNAKNINGTLYFTATDGTHGSELWKSDGTAAGTVMVKDINPGAGSSVATEFTLVNNTIFFSANDGPDLIELWKTDGSTAGTVMVKDINSAFYSSSTPSGLTNLNGTLFFTADDGTHNFEVWKSDGTAAGTTIVKDIYPGGGPHNPGNLINVSGTLFFSASDDRNTHGYELWKTDGTESGTVMVADINPHINAGGYYGSNPRYLTNVNGKLFFRANDGTHGIELWTATVDATAPGARITAASFSGATPGTFDKVRITFNEAMNASSFTTGDISFSGPNGSFAATAVTAVGGGTTQFDVTFPAQTTPGKYTLTAGPDILDLASNPLNQDVDATNGETPDDQFTFSGTIATGPTAPFLAVGDKGGRVRLVSPSGTPIAEFRPLDVGVPYTGTVEVALGDFNGDTVPDLLVSSADPAGGNDLALSKSGQVFVYDGATLLTGTIPLDPFRRITPFATTDGPGGTGGSYVNGLNIAVGDVNGDGTLDLIAGSRGGSNVAGLAEYGRVAVIDGTSPAGTDVVIGGIQKPFGSGYQKGVVVAAGNADGVGGDEIAVTRGGPVASPNPAVQRIKVKVLQLQGTALTELKLAADGSTAFAPFGALTGAANAIKRDGRVAFVDTDGNGKAELVFSALDPLTSTTNKQVRVAVFSIDPTAGTGAATIVSTGADAGTYVTGTAVVDHAITHVAATGTVENLVLLTESATSGIVYLAPLTGTVQTGGFALSVLNGGITIDSI